MNEFRPNRFEILPVIIKNLVIINVLCYLAQVVYAKNEYIDIDGFFALHTWQSPLFRPWQVVTHLFMHGSVGHLVSNMFALWMFGAILESLWGPSKFLTFYFCCGVGAALCHLLVLYYENGAMMQQFHTLNPSGGIGNARTVDFVHKYLPSYAQAYDITYNDALQLLRLRLNEATLGASGAVFGCLVAFGILFPNTRIMIYFLFPLKAKWFVLLYGLYELSQAFENSAGDNIAHVAHLGGGLVGLILAYSWKRLDNNGR